jgi:hypothetical protein
MIFVRKGCQCKDIYYIKQFPPEGDIGAWAGARNENLLAILADVVKIL